MNVKTLKRFSRRSVSMLLSVLMVVSLFTVCMVGSSITAGAIVNNAPATTITIHLNGTAAQSWENVYFVIGRDNSGNYGGSDQPKYTSFYKMTAVSGKADTYTLNFGGWQYWDQCFFAGTNMGYGTGGEYRIYSDVYNVMNAALKSSVKWGNDDVFYEGTGNDRVLKNPLELEIEAEQKESIDYTTSESIKAHKTASTKKWGTTETGYEHIYLVIGNNINVQPGATTSVYEMVKQADGTYKTPSGFSFTGAAYYFFTTIPVPSSYQGSWKKIDDAYNYVTDSSRNPNGDKVTNKFTTKLTDLELVVSNKTFIDATLYNYRSGDATNGTGGQIGGTADDTDEEKYAIDSSHDYSTGNETNYKPFRAYNQAVDAWFNGGTYTPLYAGNFRDTKYDNSVQGAVEHMVLRNFVYIANVAEHGNSHSVAVGLVDDKLHGGTITQGNGGKELPQFSDAFIEANPTLQSKYEGLKFQVNANKHMGTGNTWYSYNSSTDGNRYLDVASKKLVEGPNINNQFFPFDQSNDGNLVKCFGLKFEVEFVMPDGGMANGEKLQFNFTGDDDLWVYIDDELVLDMGGAHGAVKGTIDLSHNTSTSPNTTHPNITGTVISDSYNNTTIANMNGSHQYETNWSASHWNNSTWETNRVRTITGDAATKIQDTTKTHKMTIFYMERGLYDSNLSFNFMLPLANTLSLNQEVDNKDVNQGLKQATMDVATKDVFNTQLQTQNMAASAKNIQQYPIDASFTRKSPSGSTTYTLQEADSGTKRTSLNTASGNGTGGSGYSFVTAAYAWTDESKRIDEAGNYTDTNAASNKGVGVPLTSGYIPLLYGQTAKFFDQFFTTGVNVENDPDISFLEDEYVHRFDTSYANTIAKTHNVIRLDGGDDGQGNPKPTRAKSVYYTNTFTVEDGHGEEITHGTSGTQFHYYNADLTTNKVDASINLKHVIRVGSIQVKKEIDEGINADSRFNDKSYKFKAEYIELFGDLDNKYGATGSTWKTMDRVTYTLKEDGKADQPLTIPYTGDDAGIFKLKNGQTAVIEGIPVGTVVRVKELIEDDAEYEVKDITDGEGNVPTTTKTIEKPMFVTKPITATESNNVSVPTTYSYIIKNGLAMQTASLVINTKVTTTGVNSGIATELEKIFNNDVFGYNVRTNSKGVSTNPAKLPITSAFTRTKDGGTDTLQTVTSTTGTKGNTGNTGNDTSAYTLKSMDAYYTWTDNSGRASGSGIGVPASGDYNVHLQYDQTATFDSQIVLDKDAQSNENGYVYVDVVPSGNLYKNKEENDATTGMRAVEDANPVRVVTNLYTTSDPVITGAASTDGTRAYPKVVADLSENENVVIEYTFTNAVKLGQIKVSKTVTDGSDANINPNGSYEFTLTYHTLFGKSMGSDVPAAGWEGTSSTGKTIITDGTGKFSIKKGETVTFTGVPVQTDYKVTEVIPDGAKYTVKGATLKVNDADPSNQVEFTRTANVCEIGKSLTSNNDVSAVTVDNTYSTVPVLYRYHNRVNVNGQVTSLQGADEWTYFVKYVDGAVSTFIDSGSITEAAKTAAINAFGTVKIDNVLATYSLGTGADFNSNYTLKELLPEELAGTIADDTAASVGYKASVQALNTNGNFYEGNKVILATIKNTEKLYPVNVYYFAADPYVEGSGTNDLAKAEDGIPTVSHRQYSLPFNGVIPLNETITRLMLDDDNPTSLSSIGNYVFAYWEREISYRNGITTETEWVPVSTNYQYSYRIANDTNIRAVYRSTDGNNKKAYADESGWVVGGNNSFKALTGATTVEAPAYGKVEGKNFKITWEIAAGSNEKKYKDTSNNYTISESVAQAALAAAIAQQSAQPLIDAHLWYEEGGTAKAEYQLTNDDSYCLANDNNRTAVGNAGHDVTVTDKIVNPYVRQSGSTATDRVVFDIVFNCVGSYDNDKTAIDNVGYVLFYKTGEYINTPVSKDTLTNIIDTNKDLIDNTNEKTKVNLDNTGIGDRCQLGKYTVDKDGTAPTTDGVLNTGYINITNKNRVDLILDFANNTSNREKFYTCYTYMIRNGQIYVSDTPMTFSPKDDVNLGSGSVEPTTEAAYNLIIDNYYQLNGATDARLENGKDYTKNNKYGYALSNAYTFADGKNLTFTIRPVQPAGEIYKGKLVELVAGKNKITPITSVENGGQISYTFNKNDIGFGDAGTNNLRLKAYFDPTPVAAKFTLAPKHGIEFKVYFDDGAAPVYTVNETTGAKEVIAPYGTKIRVEAQTILNDGREGYYLIATGNFTEYEDAARTKSNSAYREVTVTTGMTNEELAAKFNSLPTANPLYYSVAVQQARGTYGATLNYTGANSITDSTETAKTTVLSHSASDSSATANILVWQGNPVITLSNTSGNYVLTAGTNTSVSGDTITVADTGAVVSIGGFATLTLSPVANATTVVNVNGTDTTITTANKDVNVPYNFDETTGTDVKVTVMSRDTDGKRYCMSDINEHNKKGYDIEEGMIATKTATLHNSVSELTDSLIPLPTPVRCYPVKIDAKAGGKVKVRWADTAYDGHISNRIIADEEDYCLVDDTTFFIEAIPNDGYTFKNWNLDDSLDSRHLTETVSDSILSSYEAYFVKEHTLTVTATTGGSVTVSGPGITGNDTVAAGETKTYTVRNDATNKIFTLSAEAADENHFVEWSGALTGTTAADQTVTMDGDKTVTASFEANGITVTLDTSRSLDNSGNKWSTGDPSLYVRYSKADNDGDNGYIKMTKNSTDNYSALIPNGYTKVIFIRSNDGSAPNSNWSNVSKQAPTGDDRYTISETDKDWVIVGWTKAIKKATTTVNFWLNGQNWTADNAGIYIYYYNSDYDNGWIEMNRTSGTGAQSRYSAVVPAGYENIKFVRTNGSGNSGWNNKWNETNNCSIAPGTTSSFKLNGFESAGIE